MQATLKIPTLLLLESSKALICTPRASFAENLKRASRYDNGHANYAM